MIRNLLVLILSTAVLACSSASQNQAPVTEVDITEDPSAIGTITSAVAEGSEEAAKGAAIGHKVGVAAGIFAAVFGGPSRESLDDVVDRYRAVRDASTLIGGTIGASKGAVNGGKRGYEFDLQMVELEKLSGIVVTRPWPNQIDVRLQTTDLTVIADIVRILGETERMVDIEAEGDRGLDVRDAFVSNGLNPAVVRVLQYQDSTGVTIHIRYRT